MAIRDPKKPWVIVPQYLAGTSPPTSVVAEMRTLFARHQLGDTSVADFWSEQSLGVVDVSRSVIKPWKSSGWSIKTYPGKDGSVERSALADHAKAAVGDMRPYRGVIAIYNYNCSGGNVGREVVFGLGGYGSTPTWAAADWRRCTKCQRMVNIALVGLPCSVGGSHVLDTRTFMTVTDSKVPKLRSVDICQKCGTLFASDVAMRPGVNECAAGGPHATLQQVKVLAGWPDPPADREWSVCSWCRSLIPDWADKECPAHPSGHEHIEKAAVHFPFLEIDMNLISPRGFLAHEMGHAYAFVHGRGIDPRSGDVDNDCWPSAYGDRFDIMSYGDCASYLPTATDPDAGQGRAGPGLTLTHLLAGAVVAPSQLFRPSLTPSKPVEQVTLRPIVETGAAGWPGARFDRYVVEYRSRGNKWDRDIDGDPGHGGINQGSVLVHYLPATDKEIPNQVPSTRGKPWLAEGDSFQPRLGMGNTAVSVRWIDGASAVVEFSLLPQSAGARTFARWLVIPYRANNSNAGFDRAKTSTLLDVAQRFWNDMAAGDYFVAGSKILSSVKDADGESSFTVAKTAAQLGALSAKKRAEAVVAAALSLPNPTNAAQTLPMDWRWFTGLILISVDGFGDGKSRPQSLNSGVFPKDAGCGSADQPRLLDSLIYDVVELPMSGITFSRLAQAIAPGFGVNDNPYSAMGTDAVARRYTPPAQTPPFGDTTWGAVGPSVSTDELAQRGWLPDWAVDKVIPHGGATPPPTMGSVTLSPLFSESYGRNGVVRAEIGPYAFELRADSGWDRGVGGPIVLAYGDPDVARLATGDRVSWGGLIPQLTGGGFVEVTSLSNDSATLAYSITERPIIVAGGGVLHAGGTVLFSPNGEIHRIPPGDPAEKRANQLIEKLKQLVKEIPG